MLATMPLTTESTQTFNIILFSWHLRGEKGKKVNIMGKKKKNLMKFICKGNRCCYPVTNVQSTYLLQDCCNARLMLNETSRILCNFLSHYPQRKTYFTIQMLISPQCLKGNLKLKRPHLKAVTTLSWTELSRHSAASPWYMKQFLFRRFFTV